MPQLPEMPDDLMDEALAFGVDVVTTLVDALRTAIDEAVDRLGWDAAGVVSRQASDEAPPMLVGRFGGTRIFHSSTGWIYVFGFGAGGIQTTDIYTSVDDFAADHPDMAATVAQSMLDRRRPRPDDAN